MPSTSGPSAGRIWSALVTVYFFWGTTYFAIDRSNQTIPSLVGPAIRFTVAGLVLMAWSRLRGGWRPPTRAQWRTAIVVGALLMFGGNGSVAVAEDLGVDTGIVALTFALVPIWLTSIDRIVLRSAPVGWRISLGLLGGFAGAILLLGGQAAADVTVAGLATAVGASLSWSIGSLYQRNAPVAQDPLQASGMQQLAGGSVTAIVALVTGQFGRLDVAAVSAESGVALLYLIVFGSLITLSAYLWLLRVARTSLVGTYAYVNPVVAVTIGWLLNDETISMQTIVAAAVILASVALIVSAGGTRRRGRDRPGSDAGEERRPKVEAEIGFEG
jgi:drug/metabolite transporter (DMT)-like permease